MRIPFFSGICNEMYILCSKHFMIQIIEININIFYIFRRICVQNSFGIILTLTHLCPGYPKISIILVYDTSTNNFGINHELTEKKEGELFGF